MHTSRLRSWFFTYPKESYVFLTASLSNAIGSSLLWPLITIYVHNVLHRSYGDAGFVLLVQSLAGVFGQFLGGALYNRLGPKRLIVGALFFSGCAQMGLVFTKLWIPYMLMMAVNGFLNAVTMPAISAFIGFRWREQRFLLFNAVYVFNNIGVAIGTSLAGILALISFNLTFLIDGLSTIGFGIFFWAFLRGTHMETSTDRSIGPRPQADQSSMWMLLREYRLYLFLALGTMTLTLTTSAWNSGVAPFLNSRGFSPAVYSSLWTVNGVIILVGQPLLAMLNRFVAKTLYARLITSAVFYFAGFAFMLMFHKFYLYLAIGMIISTFGEMLISPASPALITQTTGRSAPFYLGVVGGVGNVGRLVGPPLFGTLFDHLGILPILIIATLMALVGTFAFILHRVLGERASEAHAKPLSYSS